MFQYEAGRPTLLKDSQIIFGFGLARADGHVAGIEPAVMAHRILGSWEPSADGFQKLLRGDTDATETARPYPFFLASPIETKIKPGESSTCNVGRMLLWVRRQAHQLAHADVALDGREAGHARRAGAMGRLDALRQ